MSQRRRHSQKPDEVRERIVELMGNVPRLEMFARTRTPGWDTWGNEVKNSVEIRAPGLDDAGRMESERRWRRCSIAS
jgi:N6-adenosine-specific RNA methylase IME4